MPYPFIPALVRLADLEARYDGPIPLSERSALAFGSALAAEIAETRAEIAFYRAMIQRTRRAGKAWLARGDREMAAHAHTDLHLYLRAWRSRRRLMAELLLQAKARQMPAGDAVRRTLAIIASEIVAPRAEEKEYRP